MSVVDAFITVLLGGSAVALGVAVAYGRYHDARLRDEDDH